MPYSKKFKKALKVIVKELTDTPPFHNQTNAINRLIQSTDIEGFSDCIKYNGTAKALADFMRGRFFSNDKFIVGE